MKTAGIGYPLREPCHRVVMNQAPKANGVKPRTILKSLFCLTKATRPEYIQNRFFVEKIPEIQLMIFREGNGILGYPKQGFLEVESGPSVSESAREPIKNSESWAPSQTY